MSEKQTIEAGNSLPQPLGSACDCQNWADLDLRVRLLTGHHARCPHGGDPLAAAFKLMKELTRGIECWAARDRRRSGRRLLREGRRPAGTVVRARAAGFRYCQRSSSADGESERSEL